MRLCQCVLALVLTLKAFLFVVVCALFVTKIYAHLFRFKLAVETSYPRAQICNDPAFPPTGQLMKGGRK